MSIPTLIDLLADFAADPELRTMVLVGNPEPLFGF